MGLVLPEKIFSLLLVFSVAYAVNAAILGWLLLASGALFAHVAWKKVVYWRKRGVPTPWINPVFGNFLDYNRDGMIGFTVKNCDEHNGRFGCYLGANTYVTTDPDFWREVLIKHFDCFPDRFNLVDVVEDQSVIYNYFLTLLTGAEWKRVRSCVSPAFSSGKLKRLLPVMNVCGRELDEYLRQFADLNQEVDLKDAMSRVTLTVMTRAVFGLDANAFGAEENELVHCMRRFFAIKLHDPRFLLAMLFPNFCAYFRRATGVLVLNNDIHEYFLKLLTSIYEERKADPDAKQNYCDFFQLLLNAVDEQDEEAFSTTENNKVRRSANKSSKTLSKFEMFAQIIIFLVAGYESTASALMFLCFLLAKFPHVQQKALDEIARVVGERDDVVYEDLGQLVYLSQVVQETLRLYPVTPMINRVCTKAVSVQGQHFVPGDVVMVPVASLHQNPDVFPDPSQFDPDRFAPHLRSTHDSMSFMAFGTGPRNCIGMRFAEFEIKVVLVQLLRRYRLVEAADAPSLPLELESVAFLKPKTKLSCLFSLRTQ